MTTILTKPSIACIENDAKALLAVRETSVSIGLWNRELPGSITALSLYGVGKVQITTNQHGLHSDLSQALDEAGYNRSPARTALIEDVQILAGHFLKAMRAKLVEVRLEKITTNACRKFHADYVTARLITTYQGQGTQWLDSDATEDCDCGDPHNIQQMQTGDVAMFKGRLWSKDNPAIHRSPPIEGTGEERLVLVMNPGEAVR